MRSPVLRSWQPSFSQSPPLRTWLSPSLHVFGPPNALAPLCTLCPPTGLIVPPHVPPALLLGMLSGMLGKQPLLLGRKGGDGQRARMPDSCLIPGALEMRQNLGPAYQPGEPAGGAGGVWGSSAALGVGLCLCPIPLSLGGAGPASPFIPQTFIDADSMPGMVPKTRKAKMNETHCLTWGRSQGRGPITDGPVVREG